MPGNTQHCDVPIPEPLTVLRAFGHMHLLGRSIKVELNPHIAKAQTLLDVSKFHFDHQRRPPMPAPVTSTPATPCGSPIPHDATLRQAAELSKLHPIVVSGDGTSVEMCLGLLTATVRLDAGTAPASETIHPSGPDRGRRPRGRPKTGRIRYSLQPQPIGPTARRPDRRTHDPPI